MADPRLEPAARLLAAGVGTAYPGGVLGVAFPDGSRAFAAAGTTARPGLGAQAGPVDPAAPDTIYDLASLTKPLATVPVFLALAARGRIALDDRLGDRWPRFAGTPWASVTMAHLLAHASGMPAWLPFAAELAAAEGAAFAGTPAARDRVVERIAATPPEAPPGARETYSDLGFITLGLLLERVGGAPLDRLFRDLVAAPLGLVDAFFVPVHAGVPEALPPGLLRRVAPTETCPTRRRLLRGEVHDDNAWLLGGVAGHAGLFATAGDVLDLAGAFVAGARGGATGPFAGVDALLTRRAGPPGATRVMGFDTPAPAGSAAGDRAPPGTVGHLGFTGTSLWVDPATGAAIALLTNRVHPSRENDAIRRVRPALHDAAWRAIAATGPN